MIANNKPRYDVVGVGNAIVDVLSFHDDAFLQTLGVPKGSMMLIDESRAQSLYSKLGPSAECSGGSVANTLAGLSSLGGKTAFIGKVRDDQLGTIFRHDMRAVGVDFDTVSATTGPATARCLILITPDAQRTMNTYIGACAEINESDIDETLIADAQVTYIEGYLWEQENAKAAIRKALNTARKHNRKVAFSLSDAFCVDRHREEFLALIKHHVDILFANEAEITSLYQTSFADALERVRGECEVAALTRSEKGSSVVTADKVENVTGEKVSNVVDSTGAGDLYASGFLYGYTRGWNLIDCAKLGNHTAARIITQLGARSLKPLSDLLDA